MSTKGKRYAQFGMAMSFREIAEELGTTEQAAYKSYMNAIRKLRLRPALLRDFIALVELRRKATRANHYEELQNQA